MSTSFKESPDSQAIIEWFRTHQYPHCKAVSNLASLRSGIAMAEILTEKLPKVYHQLFLPNIEIYNLTPQQSMQNLKILLSALKTVFESQREAPCIEEFTPEGLYFDHNMMEIFVYSVIIPLQVSQEGESRGLGRERHHALQDISDIANISGIGGHLQTRNVQIERSIQKEPERETDRREEFDEEELKIQTLCQWLEEQHHIDVEASTPEAIMGELVNLTFAGSRLDKQKVIKRCHYELGSATVFKKVGDYLLDCERMPKHNILAMLQEIELGCMREELFWSVIEDIMNIKVSHLKKMRRNSKTKIERVATNPDLTPTNKENMQNGVPLQKRTDLVEKKLRQTYECNSQILHLAELWVGGELGYEFSLKKSKNAVKREDSPLLNGALLGSIVMRLQLGKVTTNKEPRNKAEIDRNMNQVVTCISRRGIEAGRKFAKVKPSYQAFLCIIWEVKTEFEKKTSLEKVRRAETDKERLEMEKTVSESSKEGIVDWLKERGVQHSSLSYVPSSLVSEVCGEILQLRLFRETTKRIKESNMKKIITQLRRLGWDSDSDSSVVLNEDNSSVRWGMLQFAYELVRRNIYYCR